MLLSSCHHILEEVPNEPPYRLTSKLHCTHYAQIYCCHFRTRITSVVLYRFSQRCNWSDLTLCQIIIYRISSIFAVHEQAFLEVVQSMGHAEQVLFRYAFHPDIFFDLTQKYGRNLHYSIRAGPDAFFILS